MMRGAVYHQEEEKKSYALVDVADFEVCFAQVGLWLLDFTIGMQLRYCV
jgi:hypothetical protein